MDEKNDDEVVAELKKFASGTLLRNMRSPNASSDLSPSNARSKMIVGNRDPDQYFQFKVENLDNLQSELKKKR